MSIGTSSQIAFRALKLGGAAQSTKPLTSASDTRWIAAGFQLIRVGFLYSAYGNRFPPAHEIEGILELRHREGEPSRQLLTKSGHDWQGGPGSFRFLFATQMLPWVSFAKRN